MPRWLLPSPAGVVWIALFTWLCSRWSTHLLSADTDSVFHILLGQLMLDQGALLQSEPTTWTYPDGHLSAHEWGAQLAMAAAYRLGGLAAVAVIVSGTIASSFAVLTAWLQHARVRVPVAVLTLCSAALVSVIHLHARPHVLTWLFVTAWVIGLELLHRRELSPIRWFATSAAVLLLWVNLHGGFLFAFFILGAYVLAGVVNLALAGTGEERDAVVTWTVRLAAAGAALLLVSAVNPQGLSVHLHLLSVATGAETQGLVGDSAAPNLMQRPHLLIYLLGALFLLVAGRERPAPRTWMLVFMLAAMSLQSIRNFPVMSFAAAVVLGPRLQQLWDEATEGTSLLARAAGLLYGPTLTLPRIELTTPILALAIGLSASSRDIALDRQLLPLDAIDFVRTRPDLAEKRMLNGYNWGAVISWELYPEHHTFINSWSDYHGNERVQRVLDLERLESGWYDTLVQLDVSWAFHERGSRLSEALIARGWQVLYRDEQAVVIVRPE